ncbi:MAG: type II toxin-antitoxin system Phd/YefM family antitoxin [Solirubrobacterales bacterium]|nr:type II toxin-antitoxin system Phd/YefM family antitoxin [Solirubrobacterales bacterium]
MTATRFKARCLAVLDDVADGAGPVVVTKHGKPVARVVPIEGPAELAGSVTFLVDDETLVKEASEAWNAER